MLYFLFGLIFGIVAYIGIYFIVRAYKDKKKKGNNTIEEKKDDRKE